MRLNDRSVSSALSYALIIVITLSLTAGLLVGTQTLVDNQRGRVAQDQLSVIGQRLASTLSTIDRLSSVGPSIDTLSIRRNFPRRVAGSQYRIVVTQRNAAGTELTLTLEARDLDIERTFDVRLQHGGSVRGMAVNGGPMVISYDGTLTHEVVIESA